jgi:asparagine synthase (glutamine-hydrolysing)
MPGIVGLITDGTPDAAKQELSAMLATLCHEKFYVAGTWSDESLGTYVGWVARKGSFSDRMPVCNERGDVVLVFSGEEYPEAGVRRRLKEQGHALDLDQDGPSYLPHMFEEDDNFPASLNGVFHGLAIDRRRGTTTLFNDRYGMRRLYYHEAKSAFYFAAEAKAILAARPELRRADPRGLGEFVACGCVLENRTLFEGISVLPGASAWSFRAGQLDRKGTYFQPKEWEDQPPLDPESYYGQLRSVFSRNLPRYFDGREQIGLALTGGLDTRLIMAWRNAAPQTLPCYTFGSMFRENQDVRVARRISRLCGQSHEVIPTGRDFLLRFAEYAERSMYLTDGCIDLARSPDLYVSQKARQIASVKIVGTYGSEVLALVPAFAPKMPRHGLFDAELSASVAQARTTYTEISRAHPVTFTAFRQTPWWHYGILALEETQLTVRSPFLDNDFIRTAYRAPASVGATRDVRRRLISDGNATLARVRTDRALGEGANVLAATVFRMLSEFTFKAEYAYDYAMPQWLAQLDHLSPLHFERLFLGRHKVFHFRVWYRDALAAYVREMLLDARALSRPYLRRQAVEALVRGHLTGDRNYTGEIHKLLALELIHRLFVDSK